MDADEIRNSEAFHQRWYYNLELAPGLFTPGHDRGGVVLTRHLLERVDVESGGTGGAGVSAMDVGIQEGLVCILLDRRGASKVVGYDRRLRRGRINLAKRALGASFDVVGKVKLQDLPGVLAEAGHDPFDVVVFAGVLHHMFDPLGGLAAVRGCVRDGGVCLVEGHVVFGDDDVMHFNRDGRLTRNGLWFMTPRCFEYLLRFVRLEPLDAVYVDTGPTDGGELTQGRLAVACRAVAEPTDEWLRRHTFGPSFAEYLDWSRVATDAPEVGYDGSREGLVKREDGRVDVPATLGSIDPLPPARERTRLALDAKY
jgi:SAM-dependent methyltransferase